MTNPTNSKSTIPPPIQHLSTKEIYLFTKIPLFKLESFAAGEFKPNKKDAQRLYDFSRRFYNNNKDYLAAIVQKKKYKAVRNFLSFSEKENLVNLPRDEYNQRLNEFLDRFWDQVVIGIAGK